MSSMVFHQGRLLDHIHLRVADLEASKTFYGAALEAVGLSIVMEGPEFFAADELFVSADGEPTSGLHLAFQARDPETVHRFHEAVLAAGGRENGAPGERRYHPGYYSAYALDPDSKNSDLTSGRLEEDQPSAPLELRRTLEHLAPHRRIAKHGGGAFAGRQVNRAPVRRVVREPAQLVEDASRSST